MIYGDVGEPTLCRTEDPFARSVRVSKVTVSIDVLTPYAHDCLKHLLDAANEFGTRAIIEGIKGVGQ